MTTITSRPYNPAMACQACVFGRFEHAKWCSTNEPFSYSFVLKSGKIVEGDELRSQWKSYMTRNFGEAATRLVSEMDHIANMRREQQEMALGVLKNDELPTYEPTKPSPKQPYEP